MIISILCSQLQDYRAGKNITLRWISIAFAVVYFTIAHDSVVKNDLLMNYDSRGTYIFYSFDATTIVCVHYRSLIEISSPGLNRVG